MKKNVLIGGVVYGMHNVGDEAILESMLESFTKAADVSVMTYGSEWIDTLYPDVKKIPIETMYDKPKLGLTATPRRKILHSIRHTFFPNLSYYKNADLFVCGGATILSDCPWHSLKYVEFADRCGIPSILWGVGMAEISDQVTKDYITGTCNSAAVEHIYTRDEFTKERLCRYGVNPEKISVCYDPAYMIDGIGDLVFFPEEAKEKYWDEFPNICVTLSGEPDVTDSNHISEMKKFVEQASKTMNVFLIPTGLGPYCRDKELLQNLVMNDRTIFINRELMPAELIEFHKNMQIIISSRLHCSIFGANVGTPSINLIRNTKQEDFAKVFGLPALKMHDIRADNLINLMKDMLVNRADISLHMKNRLQTIRKTHMDAFDDVRVKYLGKA